MELSLRERDRVLVLRQVSEGVLAGAVGAVRLGVTPRHFRRLLRRFEMEGDAAAVHGLKGRPSNRSLPAAVRELALSVAAGGRSVGAALDELGQWDSSVHPWLEGRSPGSQTLISIHDDATSRLLMARFVARDNWAAVYTDHAGHFGQWLTKKKERTGTIISRALGELGVEVVLAGSPQAKGRVERSFGTAQDRLVKEMWLEGIASLEGANRFLQSGGGHFYCALTPDISNAV